MPPLCFLIVALSAAILPALAAARVVQRSDVVFMYQAEARTYAEYGATVLAWGGKPTSNSLAAARGIRFMGSVGMVTEFSRYHGRFPQSYAEGLCRDIEGQPVKVPWLTDHQHQGIPYWWCCTHQPRFREYLRERVIETVRAGADGVHIDDHLGTAGGLWLGLCFCDRCVDGFRAHLTRLPPAELRGLGVTDAGTYDFRAGVRAWLAQDSSKQRKPVQHPLWEQWTVYQCRSAAAFMQELRDLARETAGRPVPLAANAGLLWPNHLSDYQALDLFSAETDHDAEARRLPDAPLLAYRLADAVGRPYAATASGGDWAFIQEHNLPGLVRGWIALGYAAGHCLMAPHRQWCYTPAKGTHWYQGPAAEYAPLYQFVRRHAELFDGYENHADLAVVFPYRAFSAKRETWQGLAHQLAATHISYRLLLAGDTIVIHPLTAEALDAARTLLVPDRASLLPPDRDLLERRTRSGPVFATLEEALAAVRPAVRVTAAAPVRVFPRVKAGQAVIHLLNYDYDPARDTVRPISGARLSVDTAALGIPWATTGRLLGPDRPESTVVLRAGAVELPPLGLWTVLVIPAQ